jgi:hypothetical protein
MRLCRPQSRRAVTPLALAALFSGCVDSITSPARTPTAAVSSDLSVQTSEVGTAATPVPLIDLGTGSYFNFKGGLYGTGKNVMPAAHSAAGLTRAKAIRRLGPTGAPASNGKIVLLSIGMSNTSQEFCTQLESGTPPCNSWSFVGRAMADNSRNPALVFANGAKSFQVAQYWLTPTAHNYNRVRDSVLKPLGVTERQVQVIWLKVTNLAPALPLPSSTGDAYVLAKEIGQIVRSIKVRYPNIKQVFLTSRIYGGYGGPKLNPEPYAFETAYSMKWAIGAQIVQMKNGGTLIDPKVGDMNYNTVAPWVAWGPYLWANGTTARSDGLKWPRSDFEKDGTHPSQSGEAKVAQALLTFFKTSSLTSCWFLAGRTC